MTEDTAPAPYSAACSTCGSQTAYAPGTTTLRCTSCGTELAIGETTATIREHSLEEWRGRHGGTALASIGAQVLECRGCGASIESIDLAGACQFCGGALVAVEQPDGLVPPE